MRVTLLKGPRRNTLRCHRSDGSTIEADLGVGPPAHTLARWVVEDALGLGDGLGGSGTDDDPTAVWARALTAAAAGAATPSDLPRLVRAELGDDAPVPAHRTIEGMVARLRDLVGRWVRLPIGEALVLDGLVASDDRPAA